MQCWVGIFAYEALALVHGPHCVDHAYDRHAILQGRRRIDVGAPRGQGDPREARKIARKVGPIGRRRCEHGFALVNSP